MALFLEYSEKVKNRKYPIPKQLRQYSSALYSALEKTVPKNKLKNLKDLATTKKYNRKGSDAKTNGQMSNIKYITTDDAIKRLQRADRNDITQGGVVVNNFLKHCVDKSTSQEKVSPVEPPKPTSNAVKPPEIKQQKIEGGNGTVTYNENRIIKESDERPIFYDFLEDYDAYYVLDEFFNNPNEKQNWGVLINPDMYHKALKEFTQYGKLINFPSKYVYQWMGIIMKNTAILEANTNLAGHSMYFPREEVSEFAERIDGIEIGDDYDEGTEWLYKKGLYDWMQMPDGSDAWSDFGLEPLYEIIKEYNEDLPPEKVLILVNRALDISHCRGDLSSIFIGGGKKSLDRIAEEVKKDSKKIYINESSLPLLVESKNSKWAHKKTREIIAKQQNTTVDDPRVIKHEQFFEKEWFGAENRRVDWFIVLEPNVYMWLQNSYGTVLSRYLDYIYKKATTFEKPSEYIAKIRPITDLKQLKEFIDPQMAEDKAAAMEKMKNMKVNLNQNYQVLGPLSFEEAREYGDYSGLGAGQSGRICYTQSQGTWNSSNYSNYGDNKCYLLLRNDWQEVQSVHDGSEANNGLEGLQYDGYDDYGLSMIFVWITPEGELHECNTRWNHEAKYAPGHGVDSALNEVDIANLIGVPFGKIFNVNTFVDKVEEAKQRLANGEDPKDIFTTDYGFIGKLRPVKLGNKYNILNSHNQILSDIWFDAITTSKQYLEVIKGLKRNLININDEEGNLIFNQFFDKIIPYPEYGVAIIKFIDGGYKLITLDGNSQALSSAYTEIHPFSKGIAMVRSQTRGYNFINTKGKRLFNGWFSYVEHEFDKFGTLYVEITNDGYVKQNLINEDGKFISNVWFDNIGNISEFNGDGICRVYLNGKCNLLSITRGLLSETWFDQVGYMTNEGVFVGVAKESGMKYNLLKYDGTFAFNEPFDYMNYDVQSGIYVVGKSNDGNKYNIMSIDGRIICQEWFDDIKFDGNEVIGYINNQAYIIDKKTGKIYINN